MKTLFFYDFLSFAMTANFEEKMGTFSYYEETLASIFHFVCITPAGNYMLKINNRTLEGVK